MKAASKYVGEFKDDKFNGQGTFTYADGSKYVGEFKDDKRNGQGTLYPVAGANGSGKENVSYDTIIEPPARRVSDR